MPAGLLHAGLVVFWIVWFGLASYHASSDYLVWAPVVLFCVHILVMATLLLVHAVGRLRDDR